MIGKTLGHYRVGEQLGRGGMGEVYLADDLNLNRKVALKFLPEVFAGDTERMVRFEREAKLLASLNHPNIAAIFGLEQAEGKRFIVMELVEGETLQQRISKGALPIEEALGICRQIAEGLEAAHEKGVIHRDLKPANVMITDGDKVKILDFGLAKALSEEAQSVDSSHSPTLTEAMTRPGIILGTAAYMSPEQAKGKSVDKRADIWAFGCTLYECLTGKRPFEGETVTETLAAVLTKEPDLEKVPANVHHLLRRCLEKDPKKRLRDIAEAMVWVEIAPELLPAKRPWLLRAWAAIATLLVIALAILAFLRYRGETPGERIQFQIDASPETMDYRMAVSPDGRMIAYAARTGGPAALIIHEMQSGAARKLEGTDHARYPFWSPDSRSIAFFAGGMLKRIEVSGGLPRDICPALSITRGAWNKEGTILFSPWRAPLHGVSATGGKPSIVTVLDKAKAEQGHSSPSFLPDGRHYLYVSTQTGGSRSNIYVGSLDSTQRTRLLTDAWTAAYADPGYLLFYRGKKLFAQPFDAERLAFTGEAVGITDNLLVDRYNQASFDVSQTGILVHRTGASQAESQFIWFDRTGKPLGNAGEPGMYDHAFDLSMDGRKIAVLMRTAASNNDIWIIEWERNVSTRFTFDGVDPTDVVWSPDGRRIGFSALRKGNADIYEKQSSGSGEETPVVQSPEDEWMEDWSRDGRYIAYGVGIPTDLYAIPLFGDRKSFPLVRSPYEKDEPHFSFDGKWLAYGSNESGAWQVYVVAFPAGDGKRQISTRGGGEPRWRGDGKELYYLDPDGKMMAVDIGGNTSIEPGLPHELFDTGLFVDPTLDHYAVTPDGRRFLILKPVAGSATTPITVILNWSSLLKK